MFLCLDYRDKEVRDGERWCHSRDDTALCEDGINMSRDGLACK